MQLVLRQLLTSAAFGALCSSALAVSPSFPLYALDEATVPVSQFQYIPNFPISGSATAQFTVSTPLLCANTSTPIATAVQLSTIYGGFVFGAAAATPTVSAPVAGVSQWSYSPASPQNFNFEGDTTLVCYATNAGGVRKITRDLFTDGFDPVTFDSSVILRVAQLPNSDGSGYYKYYIDISIPNVPQSANFVAREGFDTSIFDPTLGGWCMADTLASTTCSNPTVLGDVNASIPITAGHGAQFRFIVFRGLKAGMTSVPNNGAPVALATLFSPDNLLENKLDNNVAAGFGKLSDFPATVNTNATNLNGLSECNAQDTGCTLSNISFVLTDDTPESNGNLLHAVVNLFLDSTTPAPPITPDCGSSTPQTTPPVVRTCTFAIDLSASGLNLPNFATDSTNSVYAPGVSASVQIVATDPINQQTTTSLPLHVFSSKNNAPTGTQSSTWAPPDPNNGNMPTITCVLPAGPFIPSNGLSAECNGQLAGFVLGVAPGPANAVDELADQTAQFIVDATSSSIPAMTYGGNIHCELDKLSPQIFAPGGGGGAPMLTPSGPASSYALDYIINGNLGSATCEFTINDAPIAGLPGFPNGETEQDIGFQFRIVVNGTP